FAPRVRLRVRKEGWGAGQVTVLGPPAAEPLPPTCDAACRTLKTGLLRPGLALLLLVEPDRTSTVPLPNGVRSLPGQLISLDRDTLITIRFDMVIAKKWWVWVPVAFAAAGIVGATVG